LFRADRWKDGQPDGQTDMTKLIVAFHLFAKAPQSTLYREVQLFYLFKSLAYYGLDGPGSNPGGDEIFGASRPAPGPTQPPVKWVPGLSPGVNCGRGVLLTTHPLLVPRSWKSRAIPLPTLWATPDLQREHFTF